MAYTFYSKDCPKPAIGVEQFPLTIPLRDGSELHLFLGRKGVVNVGACLLAMMRDDADLAQEVHDASQSVFDNPGEK